jgi:hypothetical protein
VTTVAISRKNTAKRGKLGAMTLALGLGLGGSAQAQGVMAEERCKTIMVIISGVVQEYGGQISTDLIGDLQRKIGTDGKCDGPDEYRVWPNTKDKEALGRIRQLIAVWDACKKDPGREGCG